MDKLGPTGLRLAGRLNELRLQRGHTLGELEARLTEIGRPILLSALSKIEKGQRRVDADDLVALARALDVSPNSLLLPSHLAAIEEVALTPSTILSSETAWTWANRDRPFSATRRGIFVSYAPTDAEWASWVSWQLAQAGYDVAFDIWDLTPGTDTNSYIEDSIYRCACVIVIASNKYLESNFTAGQLSLALNRPQLPILPIITTAQELPEGPLSDRRPIRLDTKSETGARLALMSAVNELGIRSRPVHQSPSFPSTPPMAATAAHGPSMTLSIAIRPLNRIILAVELINSARYTNVVKAQSRSAMFDILETALLATGITPDLRDRRVDRGDGLLILIHATDRISKSSLLTRLVPELHKMLVQYNSNQPDNQILMKIGVHTGDVAHDEAGWFGEDIDIVSRLLDAPELQTQIQDTGAPLALVISDDLHRSIVRHGYDGIDARAFQPIRIGIAGDSYRGWVQIPQDAD